MESAGHVRLACAKARSRLPRLATFIHAVGTSLLLFSMCLTSLQGGVRVEHPCAISPRVASAVHTDVIEDVREPCVRSNGLQEDLVACRNVRGEGVGDI
jgi:hypothetical protein